MNDENPWRDILKEQPAQGQRILVRMLDGTGATTHYCRFCYEHWKIKCWKPMPVGNVRQ